MEFLCTQATLVILLEWTRDTVNDPRLRVDGFQVAGERVVRSIVGWETLQKMMELVTSVASFLTLAHTHTGKQEGYGLLCRQARRVFSSFPSQSLGELRVARGEGRYLEGIWGHLGRTNSCLAGHREKQNVLRSRKRETGGPCEGEQSTKSPLGGGEIQSCQLLPFSAK